MTQAKVQVVLRNGLRKRTVAAYAIDTPKEIPLEQLSPRADKALRAALKSLGIKLTDPYLQGGNNGA